jgi:hypothetical protein
MESAVAADLWTGRTVSRRAFLGNGRTGAICGIPGARPQALQPLGRPGLGPARPPFPQPLLRERNEDMGLDEKSSRSLSVSPSAFFCLVVVGVGGWGAAPAVQAQVELLGGLRDRCDRGTPPEGKHSFLAVFRSPVHESTWAAPSLRWKRLLPTTAQPRPGLVADMAGHLRHKSRSGRLNRDFRGRCRGISATSSGSAGAIGTCDRDGGPSPPFVPIGPSGRDEHVFVVGGEAGQPRSSHRT